MSLANNTCLLSMHHLIVWLSPTLCVSCKLFNSQLFNRMHTNNKAFFFSSSRQREETKCTLIQRYLLSSLDCFILPSIICSILLAHLPVRTQPFKILYMKLTHSCCGVFYNCFCCFCQVKAFSMSFLQKMDKELF